MAVALGRAAKGRKSVSEMPLELPPPCRTRPMENAATFCALVGSSAALKVKTTPVQALAVPRSWTLVTSSVALSSCRDSRDSIIVPGAERRRHKLASLENNMGVVPQKTTTAAPGGRRKTYRTSKRHG